MPIKLLFNRKLGEKIQNENRRITISEISRETGISRNSLINLSEGDVTRINFSTLKGLCEYFDCQPGELLIYVPDDQ